MKRKKKYVKMIKNADGKSMFKIKYLVVDIDDDDDDNNNDANDDSSDKSSSKL